MKKILFILMFLSAITLAACNGIDNKNDDENGLTRYSRQYLNVFDSSVGVIVWTDKNSDEVTDILNHIHDMLWEVHHHSTKYDSILGVNNVYYINNNPDTVIEVDPMLIEMIDMSVEIYNYPLSQGMFNISLGSVLDVWSTYRSQCLDDGICEVPSLETLEAANTMSNPNLIEIDYDNETVRIPQGMMLDLGGIAKGYGAELVGDYLREVGIDTFLVDAGSSNIEVSGINPSPHRDYWSIGLRDPDDATEAYARISLESGWNAMSSGDYERFYTVEGDDKDYHHLINPNTLMPVWHIRSVTVVAQDPTLGDLYATIAFLLEIEDAIAFIDSLEDVEAIWLDADRNIHMSANMEERFLNEILLDE